MARLPSNHRRTELKRMLLVFTNKSAIIGPGLNFDLTPEERDRLRMAVTNIRAEAAYGLGTTATMAQYTNAAMAAGCFLANDVLECAFQSFVGLNGFVEQVNKLHHSEEGIATIIVNCLSFYPDRTPEESFYPVFWRWWNERCYLFGMPTVPPHDRNGDKAALLIDYQKREVKWLMDVGHMPAL